MKELKIKFWQIENVVAMKVLDQDEKLRNKGEVFKEDNLDVTIYSNKFPAIASDSIFIKGSEKENDNKVSCVSFRSIKSATDYIEKCQELISDYNNTILEFEGIFIRGNEKKRDNIVSSISFDSTKDATDYIGKCQKLINNYNMNLEEVEIDEVIKSFIFE